MKFSKIKGIQISLSNIETPQATSPCIRFTLAGLVPFFLGFGVYPLLIPTLLVVLIGIGSISSLSFFKNFKKTFFMPGYLAFLVFLSLFFTCYRGFYLPYHPEILTMPWAFFWVLISLSMLTVIWITFFDKSKDLIEFTWLLCLGSLLFCITTIVFTMWLKKPPFYGGVLDIRYLPFGIQKIINTPGISNLLSLFPIAFLAALLLKPNQRPSWFWTLGIIGFILSLISAITLGQRSYFVVVFIISPLAVALFLLLLRSWHTLIGICALFLTYPVIILINQASGANFLQRPLNKSLFNDARFQMFRYWIERFSVDPFERIEVGPAPWSQLQWFHNFFADIHRLSGFWALLTSVALVSYIFIRLLYLIRANRRVGLFLMAIAIPCFLIMNTSVVPEAERQPFLLLLAIGAISEVILARQKCSPKSIEKDLAAKNDIGNTRILD